MLLLRSRLRILLIFLFISSSNTVLSYAVDDGFASAGKIEGEHFTIFYAPGVSIAELNQQLDINISDKILSGVPKEKAFSAEAELALGLDSLFNRTCDILDMRLYSFHGTIKVCRDYAQLNMIYRDFFNKSLGTRSFYVYSLNTIYTSADNFKLGIIGHEIAHSIISHYFPVLPSTKVQEVLAMYVEYQLKGIGR